MDHDLSNWFGDLLRLEQSDQEPPWEELEQALVHLRQRVERQDQEIEALPPDDPMREALFQIGDLLHQLCEEFDQFLESGDFQFLRVALRLALEMSQRRQELRRQLDDESHAQKIEL
ncbi:hypothetical protein JST97_25370 [bacterium]|nr:hypothetical protein [bacterium]